MPGLDFNTTRTYLNDFRFGALFIDVLGWSQPGGIQPLRVKIQAQNFSLKPVAQLAGIVVFEVSAADGQLPDARARAEIHQEAAKRYYENLLIFLDGQRTQSLWYWVKRDHAGTNRLARSLPREHLYVRGQPGDLFLGKLSAMFVDISEFDASGNINVLQVAGRLQKALDVERVTKKFYTEFAEQRLEFIEFIQGIPDEHDRRRYASVLLNRLMFIYFLQRKGFIDNGSLDYLQKHLAASQERGADCYYSEFLRLLFFEGFAKPEEKRSAQAKALLGKIRYLNGGLFLPHRVELDRRYAIAIPDQAFENLFRLFTSYSWNLDDTPSGQDNEINPDVLGYIFEKYINQKAFGAYYTRPEITEYLCEQTIYRLVLQQINTPGIPGLVAARQFESVSELLLNLDANLCRQLLLTLGKLSLLDPACGSGAFLVAAMKTMINLYSAVIGRIEFLGDQALNDWLHKTRTEHPSLAYFIKRRIITDNLYGVDIMEEAAEIARLRLFLALVASAQTVEQLEPLPNIDFNILPGNSLIGLLRVDEAAFDRQGKTTMQQGSFFQKSYRQLVDEKRRQLETYRHTTQFTEDLQFLRDEIEQGRRQAYTSLNDLLLNEFSRLGIKYEQATWDEKKQAEGKPKKRAVQLPDVEALQPFHWGYEFDEVMNTHGGFDAIITNPPWEIFKPNAKEFFAEYSDLVTKKKMTIKDFEKEQAKLLTQPEIRNAWLQYYSRYAHVNDYFRLASQYSNQTGMVSGKRTSIDLNLYKLFLEQSFNLLRSGGFCGIVLPSGIYTDLGTKQLRELLFGQSQITGLFCFENRKEIFDGVHRSFKFVVLTYQKGGITDEFPAAFMRHDPTELVGFPYQGGISIPVDLIRRLSPDTLSVMEFTNANDVQIAEKMGYFPLFGEPIKETWNIEFHREFHMTGDSHLFRTSNCEDCLPLFEGKMIHQFTPVFSEPRYWIKTSDGRKALLGNTQERKQQLDYQSYRLVYRSIASSTNERTMISTILPPNVFFGHSMNAATGIKEYDVLLYVVAILNSFVIDYSLRLRVAANLTMFYIYQLPVPRLTAKDPAFAPIVQRAARLICTTPEFDDLAREVGLGSHKNGAADPVERARLRAELDGLAAHLYNLTEEEFAHILNAFPLVADPVKVAAQNAYRDVERGLLK